MKNQTNFFTDENTFKTIDTFRIVYLITAVLWFFITEAGRTIYRPFIYENNINDYGIADSIGNSGGIIVQIFFMLAVLNSPKKKAFRIMGFVIVGYIIYETAQLYLPKGVFDWLDIYGTLIGGFFSIIIFLMIHALIKKNKVVYTLKK